MRCAYSSITCPAGKDAPGHHGGDIVAAVETPAAVGAALRDDATLMSLRLAEASETPAGNEAESGKGARSIFLAAE